ncbi:methylase, putative [Babesia caballi]|uniref:Methylase, putative n=1 Tax=Babesia caballi TaxID=5871 RepID=A0AAV4M1F4_BABCB|nr:methylase, putative [Babesia caballi]
MEGFGYEWYTGHRMPRAVGETVGEALEKYQLEIEAELEEIAGGSTGTNVRPKSAIQFTGIAVEISHEDQMNIVNEVNRGIEKWSPICAAHLAVTCNVIEGSEQPMKYYEKETCEVSTIRLQSSHHVTLFHYGSNDPEEELSDPVVHNALQRIDFGDVQMKTLWKALTPYEFSIAILYRLFYGIRLPFEERPRQCEEKEARELGKYVAVTLQHVVFVPGVLICATALLDRDLVAVPWPDGTLGPYPHQPRGAASNMTRLHKLCSDGGAIMVEENHCTHVSLGVTKEYKPVVSNNICQAIRGYLDFLEQHKEACQHEELWNINKVHEDKNVRPMQPEELLGILGVSGSRCSEFKHAKGNFVEIVPHVLDGCDEAALTRAASASTFDKALPQAKGEPEKQIQRYKDTVCFVADDTRWICILNLPVNRSPRGANGADDSDWFVDAYINALHKKVTGEMKFF